VDGDFLSMVNAHAARAVRRGSADAQRLAGASSMTFEAKAFGEHNPLRNSAIHWDAEPGKVAHRQAAGPFAEDEEHDPDAPVSVVHAHYGSSVQVNDPSAVRYRGVQVVSHPVDLRGWMPAAHATSPEVADQVSGLVRSGRHGLLMSEHGASGPGVYIFGGRHPRQTAAGSSYHEGAVVEGVASPGRSFEDRNDRVSQHLVEMQRTDYGREHGKQIREALMSRGVGHVYDRNEGAALLHPSQFRVTAIHTGSGSVHFDPAEQRFRPGDPVWSPKTHGR